MPTSEKKRRNFHVTMVTEGRNNKSNMDMCMTCCASLIKSIFYLNITQYI